MLLAEWFDQNRLLDLFAGPALRALGLGGQAPHLPIREPLERHKRRGTAYDCAHKRYRAHGGLELPVEKASFCMN